MAYTVTTANLKTRILNAADMANTSYISDAELLTYINAAYASFYDLVTKADPLNYMGITPTTVTFTSTTNYANLPADYYRMVGVDVQSGGDWIPISSFQFGGRGYTTVASSGTARIWYVPAPTVFTNVTTDNFDGVAGWEEYIVQMCAIDCLNKEESNTNAQRAKLAEVTARIQAAADSRDAGSPPRITSRNRDYSIPELERTKYCIIGNRIMFVSDVPWR